MIKEYCSVDDYLRQHDIDFVSFPKQNGIEYKIFAEHIKLKIAEMPRVNNVYYSFECVGKENKMQYRIQAWFMKTLYKLMGMF